MYTKALLGLFYVLHMLSVGLALPAVSGQASSGGAASISADNIDQTMKDAVQTLLAGLIMKGNDLRAELQEEARALLDDPYPFDEATLSEVAQLAAQEVKEAARGPEPDPIAEEDPAGDDGLAGDPETTPLAREAPESDDGTKSVRSLADDTLHELKRLYARSEIPVPAAEPHHKFSDYFHMPSISLSTLLGEYPTYPMDPSLPTVPVTTVVEPVAEVPAVVPVPDAAVVDAVPPPVVAAAPVVAPVVPVVPEVPPVPVARSVEDEPSATEDN